MPAGRLLRYARNARGFSQRELADRSGLPQPAVARIESGHTNPRIDTLKTLLRACGVRIDLAPLCGNEVDRTVIRRLLALSPEQRARLAVAEARNLEKVRMRKSP